VDTKSPTVWFQSNNVGNIIDTMLMEAQENTKNQSKEILLHIRYLMNSSLLLNLLLEYSNSTNSENKSTRTFRG
jgi:hypothetical protein